MRRMMLALVAAVAGLAGVVGLHRPVGLVRHLAAGPVAAGSRTGGASGSSGATPSAAPRPAPARSALARSAPAGSVRTVTGPKEPYGYGTFAVRVTGTRTKINSISVVGLRTAESYSQQLAAQVLPMLRHEALSAQSARINGISGATYTCEAYATSLQSALDMLHKA